MRCPKCGCEDSKVIDSRSSEAGTAIRRRRECLNPACAERFTTYERREETPIQVRKKDGTLEPFDRAKLMASLVKASIKRSIPVEELNGLISSIEAQLRNEFRTCLLYTSTGAASGSPNKTSRTFLRAWNGLLRTFPSATTSPWKAAPRSVSPTTPSR